MCGSFVVGRVIYTLGYKTGNPARVRKFSFCPVLSLTEMFREFRALSLQPCPGLVSES